MKYLNTLTALSLLLSAPALASDIPFPQQGQGIILEKTPKIEKNNLFQKLAPKLLGPRPGHVGFYLAGRHAQALQDWHTANHYLGIAARKDPANADLQRRAMVIAMGAGNLKRASEYARQILTLTNGDPLASLFVATSHLKDAEYKKAQNTLKDMSGGGMSEFARPLLMAWLKAAQGKFDVSELSMQPLDAFHAALMAKILNKEAEGIAFINKVKDVMKMTPSLKLADAFFILDQKDIARSIYKTLNTEPTAHIVKNRLNALTTKTKPPFTLAENATDGMALALLDMAKILSAQDSTDSARIFSHLALSIDSDQEESHILLAKIHSDTGQYGPALAHYKEIKLDSRYAVDVQLKISEIYEVHGNTDKAIESLKDFQSQRPHVDIMVQIGDLQRRDQNYMAAISEYNKALASFQNDVPDQYWFLYYTRGMAYERLGQWTEAENDFIKALEYRPDEPYVLNYLAYGWAERGINLSKSLEYLEKATALAPNDGHIKDSLGWTLYKLGRYADAIMPLERAIGYLPYDPIVNEHLGDAYWKVGRKREALFQWQRALNHVEDDATNILSERLENKLLVGLPSKGAVMSAENNIKTD